MTELIREVRVSPAEVLVTELERVASSGGHVLLLSDDSLREQLDGVLRAYLLQRESTARDFIVTFEGERMSDRAEFFREVRRAVPLAGYMGDGMDALADVMRFEALSKDSEKRTYWVWRNADLLYARDRAAFESAFHILTRCAREASKGLSPSPGTSAAPWTRWTPQPVILLLTAFGEAMRAEAGRLDSFLFRFPAKWAPSFANLDTGLSVWQVV